MSQAALAPRTGIRWYQRAGVWIGIGVGPGTFTVGGALAANLPLASLLILIPLGTLMLGALTVAQATVSRRTRELASERAVSTFGKNWGSILFNLIVALGAIGFVSFYVGLAGFAAATLLGIPGWLGALAVAAGLFAVNAAGLDRWNSLVWLTAISTIIVTVFTFYSVGTHWAPDQVSHVGLGEAVWAIISIVNYGLFFALRSGDFSWDLDRDEEVTKAALSLCLPLIIFLMIGALVYRAAGNYNIADVLASSQAVWLGNLFLIISVIAPVMSGFHSGGLALPTFLPLGKHGSALVIAGLGFILGAMRFDRELLLFLDLLGATLAPALVVMLLMATLKNGPSRTSALAAWLLGVVAAYLAKWQGASPVVVGGATSFVALTAFAGWTHLTARPLEQEGEK